ncbi:MAG: hypothetical protein ACFB9N_01300 [Geitlerinemataceae cyanobacterium]
MLEQFQQRLDALKTEYASSQNAMADLNAKRAALRDTMLRLSGAIQVLEEELTRAGNPGAAPPSALSETPASTAVPGTASSSTSGAAINAVPNAIPLPSTYEILDANDSV